MPQPIIDKAFFRVLFAGRKTRFQQAEQILRRLRGYRQTSLSRADDTDMLMSALEALIEVEQS